MAKFLIAFFVILHGLVHLWYVVLSQNLVEFKPEMGWTGRSWILTNLIGSPITRQLAGILYGLAAVALVAGGLGIIFRSNWWQPVLVGSAVLSATIILLFWDGSMERILEKGLLGFLISIAIVGVVLGTARYRSEIRSVQEDIDSLGSQVVETDCGPIEYVQIGEGYPVLSIHGNGGGFDQGLSLAQTYLGEGFQIIAPSRFGYLDSPLPAGATPVEQADAYACLLDALGIEQTAIFTTSAGVTSSIQFVLRHPERLSAMVLHSPNAPGKVEVQLPPKPVFRAMLRSDFLYWLVGTNMLSMFVPKELPLTDEMAADIRQAALSVLPSSRRANGMVFDTYFGNQEINHYPLEQVNTPTLVISAVDDPAALHENARTLAERIPGARLVAIPDGGHLMLGHTVEVKAEVTQFLRDNVADLKNSQ
jgi:pimeloyl-ACP methyl ester carboxylesterase